jgi:flavin reductase (DIM6/NTAB) family NADH-FMN oxidoreductase RutF
MQNLEPQKDPIEALRATFRRHASGVSVITTVSADGSPVGFTATSMTSLGANPPLASFNVARGSSTWPSIENAKYVAIHTLGASNLELAARMAADHTQRFVPQDWKIGPMGVPVFPTATAILIAKVRQIVNIEANAVVIVDILEGLLGEQDDALLYCQRQYFSPGEALNSAG